LEVYLFFLGKKGGASPYCKCISIKGQRTKYKLKQGARRKEQKKRGVKRRKKRSLKRL
jgi:hypothetical protein